ncbi:hypothetical protein L246_12295 [Salmonella enterica subsp. enterica serovar Worthington str. BCH-5715]|nr:hypothetical protein L246_12295 [Salmonella enterica subsp. enterica serovar Worthington str. BCH-5715]
MIRSAASSYLMSDLQAAYLWAQLEAADRINQQRRAAFAASGVIFGFMEAKTADVTDRP